MLSLRPYQKEAVDAVYQYLRDHDDNPCVVTPTASGKSVMIAKVASDAVSLWRGRVLVLAHVKELLEQNAGKVKALCDGISVGVYSAGLNSRDTDTPILVAGIQSVYDKADQLGKFDLIVIDEAHLVAPDGEGMYRTFLADMKVINPLVRIIGFTATPFRMKGGLICKPENMLNAVCYEVGIKRMISDGYLSPIISKAGKVEANLSSLHVRGGEFINTEIEAAMDKNEITDAACREVVELTQDRKSVLIFCTSIEHCRHVAEKIESITQMECAIVTGDTPAAERDEILVRFKGGKVPADLLGNMKPPLKFLANVNVLTTGFDAPNVDCVVLLRPTASAGLLIQMVGRGFRLSPDTGKENCLVLDYGENILRHGPIDCIVVKDKKPGHGDAPAKKCPQCNSLIHAGYSVCPECGFEFPPSMAVNISRHASKEAILSGQATYDDLMVSGVQYFVHAKRGADESIPKTMQVDYEIGFCQFKSEWVCPEHSGYAREKFVKWWKKRTPEGSRVPATAAEAVAMAREGLIAEPSAIRIKRIAGEKYDTICGYTLKDIPTMREPGDDTVEIAAEDPSWLREPQNYYPVDEVIPF